MSITVSWGIVIPCGLFIISEVLGLIPTTPNSITDVLINMVKNAFRKSAVEAVPILNTIPQIVVNSPDTPK